MTFSIYALLDDSSPAISIDSLAAELNELFRGERAFSLTFEHLPFAKAKSLALRWDSWLARVAYEEGQHVVEDSVEIERLLRSSAPNGLSAICKRIRVVFGKDDAAQYTNQIIYVLDFLRTIPGSVLFDPQQNDLVR